MGRGPQLRALLHALPALLLTLGAAGGCTAPMAYGRTAEVAAPGQLRGAIGNNLGMAVTSVEVQNVGGPGSDDGTHYDFGASQYDDHDVPPAGIFFSTELAGSIGVFEPCELGPFGGLVRMGLEARCGLLPSRAPVALALSAAASIQNPLGRLVDDSGLEDVTELRAGFDLSPRGGPWLPFMGVYVGKVPFERRVEVEVDDTTGTGAGRDLSLEARAERDEYRIAVPVGVAWPTSQELLTLTVALIPEITVATAREEPIELGYYVDPIRSFDQTFALYLAVRAELGRRPGAEPSGPSY